MHPASAAARVPGPDGGHARTCHSVEQCQLLGKELFRKTILLPHGAHFIGGGYSSQGLGMFFKLPAEDFDTIVNSSPLKC